MWVNVSEHYIIVVIMSVILLFNNKRVKREARQTLKYQAKVTYDMWGLNGIEKAKICTFLKEKRVS